jgi:hypothetical protein
MTDVKTIVGCVCKLEIIVKKDEGKIHPWTGHEDPEVE